MTAPFTPVVHGLDWQAVAFHNQMRSALDERRAAIGLASAFPALGTGADLQAAAIYSALQSGMESICTEFLNHTGGDANFPAWYTLASWRAAAGLGAGFRRATTWGAYSYGTMQAGDIIGPWVFQDIQRGLSALQWTFRRPWDSPGYTHQYGIGWQRSLIVKPEDYLVEPFPEDEPSTLCTDLRDAFISRYNLGGSSVNTQPGLWGEMVSVELRHGVDWLDSYWQQTAQFDAGTSACSVSAAPAPFIPVLWGLLCNFTLPVEAPYADLRLLTDLTDPVPDRLLYKQGYSAPLTVYNHISGIIRLNQAGATGGSWSHPRVKDCLAAKDFVTSSTELVPIGCPVDSYAGGQGMLPGVLFKWQFTNSG